MVADVPDPVWTAPLIVSVGSLIVAIGSAIVALRALRHNTRAMELQTLQSMFHDVLNLDREYLTNFQAWDASHKNAWCATFYNTVEYMCFVINQKMTKDKELRKFFFNDALPAWRKQLDGHVKEGYIADSPVMFPEFKKAARELTEP